MTSLSGHDSTLTMWNLWIISCMLQISVNSPLSLFFYSCCTSHQPVGGRLKEGNIFNLLLFDTQIRWTSQTWSIVAKFCSLRRFNRTALYSNFKGLSKHFQRYQICHVEFGGNVYKWMHSKSKIIQFDVRAALYSFSITLECVCDTLWGNDFFL